MENGTWLALDVMNISENNSKCERLGEAEQCHFCDTFNYWLEGPGILVICLAGILGKNVE